MNWIDFSLVVLISLPILATFILGFALMRNGKQAMGKPTIQPLFFYTAKFLLFGIWALFCVVSIFPQYRGLIPFLIQTEIPEVQKLLTAILLIPANLIIVPAYLSMGLVTHIGIPKTKHELRTSGIYHYSRNPMYFSFVFLNLATFLFLPSILLLAIMIYGMIVHHYIVLGEEKYLEQQFGEEYLQYKQEVPRYI